MSFHKIWNIRFRIILILLSTFLVNCTNQSLLQIEKEEFTTATTPKLLDISEQTINHISGSNTHENYRPLPQRVTPVILEQELPQSRTGNSRGYLTTPDELKVIAQKAAKGIQPYQTAVAEVLEWAEHKWDFKLKKITTCKNADDPKWLDEKKSIPVLYAKAVAYHLTDNVTYAKDVVTILERIMTEVKQISLEDNQCRLNFGWHTPELVASADLIEEFWYMQTCMGPVSTLYENLIIRSGNCKTLFQNWLIKNPYYVVSYTADDSKSNWGAAATNATAYIADYLWDRPNVLLIHRNHDKFDDGSDFAFSPAEAYIHANQLMLDRMNGYGVEYGSRNSCDYLSSSQQSERWAPVKSQITENGIIPEDARREEYCNIPQYNGEYQNYPQIHLGNNIQQCELMLRRGDHSCYKNIDHSDVPQYRFVDPKGEIQITRLYPGRGSIERAIKAIIVDSATQWRHDSALEVAYRYYYNHHTLPGFEQWFEQLDRPGDCSQNVCFGTLTHGFAAGETPTVPPTVSPP